MADQVNMDQFDCAVPWSDIPTSDTVPEGRHVIRIKEFKLAQSQEGKLMAVLYSSIDEGPLAGIPFPIQNFVLGTVDDPMCQRDPHTWRQSFGGRELNKCLEATGIAKDERSLRATLKRTEQARFQAFVTVSLQKEGEYKGTERNKITKYAPYGAEMNVPGARKAGASGLNGTASTEPPQPRRRDRPDMAQRPEVVQMPPAEDDIAY